jgi:hypothetical protein
MALGAPQRRKKDAAPHPYLAVVTGGLTINSWHTGTGPPTSPVNRSMDGLRGSDETVQRGQARVGLS